MKTGVRLIISLMLLLMFAVQAPAQKRSLPIRVLDATEQSWFSGAPGGYSGISYSIKVYINTHRPIELEYVWLGKEYVPFQLEMMNLEIDKKPGLGDSVLLTYRSVYGLKDTTIQPKPLPVAYKGAALIQCRVDGKTRYFIVTKFRPLPALQGQ